MVGSNIPLLLHAQIAAIQLRRAECNEAIQAASSAQNAKQPRHVARAVYETSFTFLYLGSSGS